MNKPVIGFIGQGFIGKHMADDFATRGYDIVRYAAEESYAENKDAIASCDFTFIAVPTPTTPKGFDFSIIRSVLSLIGNGKVAVIKSTILPGTTESLQKDFPDIIVMHSPEFLREASAAEDTAHPDRNIVGICEDTKQTRELAEQVMSVLPKAPYGVITPARNAECIKYIGNTFLYSKLVFMNIANQFVESAGADWETVRQAVGHDSRIGLGHTDVIRDHGRGAGGHCFIKDYEALIEYYDAHAQDETGLEALKAYRAKNNELLVDSQKDLNILHGIYGDDIPL